MESKNYDPFPASIVLLANAVGFSTYVVGGYILSGLGRWVVLAYVGYCLWVEFRILKKSCVNCTYYGKRCGLGKGRLCSWLFKQGDPDRFAKSVLSWLDILPDFLVSLVPLVVGIVLLMRGFSWAVLALLVALLVLSFGGNVIVRGSFACKYCRQREIGCPAQRLFSGQKQQVC